jgi:hypothetical protein
VVVPDKINRAGLGIAEEKKEVDKQLCPSQNSKVFMPFFIQGNFPPHFMRDLRHEKP